MKLKISLSYRSFEMNSHERNKIKKMKTNAYHAKRLENIKNIHFIKYMH